MLIQEKELPIHPLTMNITIDSKQMQTLIDTGASGNYISRGLIKTLDLRTIKRDRSTSATPEDGSIVHINEKIDIKFNTDNHQSTIYKAKFDVIEWENNSHTLGMPYLFEKFCKINSEEGILRFDNQEFELSDKYDPDSLEKTPISDTDINSITDASQKIKDLIKKAKNKNPRRSIKTTKHEIHSKKHPDENKKKYRVPLKIKKAEDFIKELRDTKIIRICTTNYVSPVFL